MAKFRDSPHSFTVQCDPNVTEHCTMNRVTTYINPPPKPWNFEGPVSYDASVSAPEPGETPWNFLADS